MMHGPMNVKDLDEFIVRINDDNRVHSHIIRQQLYFLIVSGLGLIVACISACYSDYGH
jgi:hypothetical protein